MEQDSRIRPMWTLGIVLLLSLPALTVAQLPANQVPADWKKIEACGVTLYLPPELSKVEGVTGMDNCEALYGGDKLSVRSVDGFRIHAAMKNQGDRKAAERIFRSLEFLKSTLLETFASWKIVSRRLALVRSPQPHHLARLSSDDRA